MRQWPDYLQEKVVALCWVQWGDKNHSVWNPSSNTKERGPLEQNMLDASGRWLKKSSRCWDHFLPQLEDKNEPNLDRVLSSVFWCIHQREKPMYRLRDDSHIRSGMLHCSKVGNHGKQQWCLNGRCLRLHDGFWLGKGKKLGKGSYGNRLLSISLNHQLRSKTHLSDRSGYSELQGSHGKHNLLSCACKKSNQGGDSCAKKNIFIIQWWEVIDI